MPSFYLLSSAREEWIPRANMILRQILLCAGLLLLVDHNSLKTSAKDLSSWKMEHQINIPLPFTSWPSVTISFPISYNFTTTSRKAKSRNMEEDQYEMFNSIEQTLQTLGIDGRACLLKTICEISRNPINHLSVLAEIATVLLTPKRSNGSQSFLLDYLEAEKLGKTKSDCLKAYATCPFSIPTLLTGFKYLG